MSPCSAPRAAVGVGEAAYGTIAPSLIADYFPVDRRGKAFAIFFCAIPVGSALGYVVGGAVDVRWGWRNAFFIAAVPGLLAAALLLKLREPRRGAQEATGKDALPLPKLHSLREAYRSLFANRPYLLAVLGYAAYTFALGGLAFWMPSFLERVRGVPKQQATVQFGAIVIATGFVGTFVGGWLGDRLLRRNEQAYLWLSGVATLLAAPFAWLAFSAKRPALYLGAIAVAEVLIFVSTGPINSAIVNLVAPQIRATAVALSIFLMHVLGDVPSPPLIGWISDRSSLQRAIQIIPIAVIVSGLTWCWAARTAANVRGGLRQTTDH